MIGRLYQQGTGVHTSAQVSHGVGRGRHGQRGSWRLLVVLISESREATGYKRVNCIFYKKENNTTHRVKKMKSMWTYCRFDPRDRSDLL